MTHRCQLQTTQPLAGFVGLGMIVLLFLFTLAGCADSSSKSTSVTSTTVDQSTSSNAQGSTSMPGTSAIGPTSTTIPDRYGKPASFSESPVSVPPSVDLGRLQAVYTPDDGVGERVIFVFEGDVPPGFAVQYVKSSDENSSVLKVNLALASTFKSDGSSALTGPTDRTVVASEYVISTKLTRSTNSTLIFDLGLKGVEKYAVRTFRSPGAIVIDFPSESEGGGGAIT